MMKSIPKFKSDEEAAEFWDTHDLTDYEDELETVEDVVFDLKPLKPVCLRLPEQQIARLKRIAATKGMGYQTMVRMWIMEKAREEDAA
jgi:predicted DNA binding CopG/RHH family protein